MCGANRIGHGVAIIEDIQQDEAGGDALGDFAAYVLNEQIPLEMCPSSNVQTGAAASIAEHPIHHLDRLGFRVTVNPDNRLMSATTLTRSSPCSPRHSTTRLKTYAGSRSTLPRASLRPTASAKRWLRRSLRPDRRRSQVRTSFGEVGGLKWN